MSGGAIILALALIADAALGEPERIWSRVPHPAVLMGRAVDTLDNSLNQGVSRRSRGVLALAILALVAILIGRLFEVISLFGLIDLVVVAVLVAQRSLVQHVSAVAEALRESLSAGRKSVALIVGRDVREADEPAIVRASIESGAENFSDGVVAPVFWYLIGGLPGILLYKMVNTADSMIGHRTPRYEAFGWAVARFDDLLNWIPARISAALIMVSHGRFTGWNDVAHDARQHRSPNAGWPEAAMARCLGVALSGPRSYGGEMRDFPFVYPEGVRYPGPATIDACVRALWRSWGVMLFFVVLIAAI